MKSIASLLVAGTLALCAGCATSVKSTYSPVSPPTYTGRIDKSVTIAEVADKRGMEPTGYYRSPQVLDKANYERNVSDVVREALQAELNRAGANVYESTETGVGVSGIVLKAEVLEYLAEVTTILFKPDLLELKISIRFTWTDSNGKLEENERSERITRQLRNRPMLPLDGAEIRVYGEKLMNSVLPLVIEKEIRLNKLFN